ncbi:hypothetical protein [Streptomyces sp. NPDC050560]
MAPTTGLSAYHEFLFAVTMVLFLALQRRFIEGLASSGFGGM